MPPRRLLKSLKRARPAPPAHGGLATAIALAAGVLFAVLCYRLTYARRRLDLEAESGLGDGEDDLDALRNTPDALLEGAAESLLLPLALGELAETGEVEEERQLELSAEDLEEVAEEAAPATPRGGEVHRARGRKVPAAAVGGPLQTTIIDAPAQLANDPHPVLKFEANQPGCTFKVKMDTSGWIQATSPLRFKNPLTDGWHVFTVAAVDAAGRVDPAPAQAVWKLDSTAPKAFLEEFPSDPSSLTSAAFVVRANEKHCTMPYQVDVRSKGHIAWDALSPARHTVEVQALSAFKVRVEVHNLTDAQYRFSVTARDAAGNAARPLVFVWGVDTTPPQTVIHSGPQKLFASREAPFIISADGEDPTAYTYQYRVNGGPWAQGDTSKVVGSGYEFTLNQAQEGPMLVEIRCVDLAGNADPTPARHSFTIHVDPTDTFVRRRPAALSNEAEPVFVIDSTETQYTYAYRLDGGPVQRPDGRRLVRGETQFRVQVGDGEHTIQIRTTDVTGAEDPTPAVYKWTVDLTPPVVQVLQRPPDVTVRKEAMFAIDASEEYSAKYRVDGGEWDRVDQSGRFHVGEIKFRVMDLYEGKHWLEVNATDRAGNCGSIPPLNWVVDLGPPKTSFLETPEKHSHSRRAAFHVQASEGDCKYEYRMDRGAWKSAQRHSAEVVEYQALQSEKHTTGIRLTLHVLAGFHLFEMRATDANGNRDTEPAAFDWVVY